MSGASASGSPARGASFDDVGGREGAGTEVPASGIATTVTAGCRTLFE
ncbi:hypothetical protein [Arthrobacter sp. 1088]